MIGKHRLEISALLRYSSSNLWGREKSRSQWNKSKKAVNIMKSPSKETELNTKDLLSRLHKISGQCQGIERMIQDGKPTEYILLQINAAKTALHRVGQVVLQRSINAQLLESSRSKVAAHESAEKLETIIDYFSLLSK